MTSKLSPTTLKRLAGITAATALAGAAFLPATLASAADTVVKLPAKLATIDAAGFKNDAYTLPVVTGVTWKVKIGAGAEAAAVAGDVKAVKPFSTAPAADSKGKVAVLVTPVAESGYALPKSPTAYKLSFATNLVKVKVKAPVVVVDKATGFATSVTIPYVAGVTYTVGGKAVDTTTKKPFAFTPTAATTEVTTSIGDGYQADGVAFDKWALATKDANADVTATAPTSVDGVGAADYVQVTGQTGVIWTVGGKAINAKDGQVVNVKPAKGATSVNATLTAAPGFALTNSTTSWDFTFTPLTNAAVTVTPAKLTVTIKGDPKVKAWKFGKTVIAVPADSEVTVTVPTAGDLIGEPVSGYALTSSGGATNGKGVLTIPLKAS